MSGFDTRWLDLREPADQAARDRDLAAKAAALVPAGGRILDLGSGTGSTVRALSPKLSPAVRWTLVDNDPALLAEAERRTQASTMLADLDAVDALPLADADLVTASALFDLVSAEWLERFADRLAASGRPLYAALSYDGRMAWSAAHDADAAVVSAFNRHQRTDKGLGAALGPDAVNALRGAFEARGYRVTTAQSDWRLAEADTALESELLAGIAAAATETGILEAAEPVSWLRARRDRTGTGCRIGHVDLLAVAVSRA